MSQNGVVLAAIDVEVFYESRVSNGSRLFLSHEKEINQNESSSRSKIPMIFEVRRLIER